MRQGARYVEPPVREADPGAKPFGMRGHPFARPRRDGKSVHAAAVWLKRRLVKAASAAGTSPRRIAGASARA